MTWLTFVAARPDGELLAVARKDGWLCVWAPRDGRVVATQQLGGFINKIGWTVDGAYLLATDGDDLVVFDADGKQRLDAIPTGHDQLRTFGVHPSKPLVGTTGGDGLVRIFELPSGKRTGEYLQKWAEGSGGGTALAMSEDTIIVGYESGYFAVCDPDGSNTGGGRVFSHYVASLAHVPGTKSFVAGGGKGRLAHLGITEKLEIVQTWSDPPKPIAANTIEFDARKRFVVACSDDTAAFYESVARRSASTFGTAFWSERKSWKQDYIVSAACFIPKTNLVATSHFTGEVKIWDIDRYYTTAAIVTFENGAVQMSKPWDELTRSDT